MFTFTETQQIPFIVLMFRAVGGLFVILGVLSLLVEWMGSNQSYPFNPYSSTNDISFMLIAGGTVFYLLAVPMTTGFIWLYHAGMFIDAFLSQKFSVAIVRLNYGEAILIVAVVAVIGLGYVYLYHWPGAKPTYRKPPERWY